MKKKTSYDVIIGLFVLTGLLIAAVLILKFGGYRSPAGRYEITVTFNNVGGLLVDAPVRYAGVVAGRVKKIIPWGTDSKIKRVQVLLNLDNWVTIRKADEIHITSANLLGDKLIEIRPTDFTTSRVEPGGEIKGKDFEEVMTMATDLMEKIIDNRTRENIKQFAHNMRVLTDESIQKSIKENLSRWSEVAKKLNRMFDSTTEEELRDLLVNVKEGSQNFSEASKKISDFVDNEGQEIAAAFRELKRTSQEVSEFAGVMGQIAGKINEGEGLLIKLITESDDLYEKLALFIKGLEQYGPLKYYKYKNIERRRLERETKKKERSH